MNQVAHLIPVSRVTDDLEVSITSQPFTTVLELNPFADVYAARDRNGELWIYNFKTEKCPAEDDTGMWCLDEEEGQRGAQLPGWMYPDIQWQDDEPTLILKAIKEGGHA
ncbi:MAG: hypothetical protein HUJ30_02745 [Gammaproteobacteria bacterium]|nr:hypothetical protein [Gammaproteobacteria bacterium]